MKIEYIKANGILYRPVKKETQHPSYHPGLFMNVCFIKKLLFGKWQIDYFDENVSFDKKGFSTFNDNQEPNVRIILYLSGIEEIKYIL